jgi:mannose-1-phosphate guanylyltransferase
MLSVLSAELEKRDPKPIQQMLRLTKIVSHLKGEVVLFNQSDIEQLRKKLEDDLDQAGFGDASVAISLAYYELAKNALKARETMEIIKRYDDLDTFLLLDVAEKEKFLVEAQAAARMTEIHIEYSFDRPNDFHLKISNNLDLSGNSKEQLSLKKRIEESYNQEPELAKRMHIILETWMRRPEDLRLTTTGRALAVSKKFLEEQGGKLYPPDYKKGLTIFEFSCPPTVDWERLNIGILSGGESKRLFPFNKVLSTFLDPSGRGISLLQQTIERVTKHPIEGTFLPLDRVFVGTTKSIQIKTAQQLTGFPVDHLLVDPENRNDPLLSILWMMAHIEAKDPDAILGVLPADQIVYNVKKFRECLAKAVAVTQHSESIVAIGTKPNTQDPATWVNYDVLKAGPKVNARAVRIIDWQKNPGEKMVKKMIAEGGYYWNAAWPVVKIATLKNILEKHQPDMYTSYKEVAKALREKNIEAAAYAFKSLSQMKEETMLSIMKEGQFLMIPADFHMVDTGNWNALQNILPLNKDKNVIVGNVNATNVCDSTLVADNGVTLNVNDLEGVAVAMSSSGDVLITLRKHAAQVKKAINQLSKTNVVLSNSSGTEVFNNGPGSVVVDEMPDLIIRKDGLRIMICKKSGTILGTTLSISDAQWIVKRVENRVSASAPMIDIRNELINELSSKSLDSLVREGMQQLPASAPAAALFRNQVLKEAGFLHNFRVISGGEDFVYEPVRVYVDQRDLDLMSFAREKFESHKQTLIKSMDAYWKSIDNMKKEVYEFGSPHDNGKPDISINISTFSSRMKHILRRLNELGKISSKDSFEIVVVIADPENYSVENIDTIKQAMKQCRFPGTLILSLVNIIGVNRNLATRYARGCYRVYLDDDVSLIGPAIEKVVDVLKKHPMIGLATLPIYDSKGLFTPRQFSLKFRVRPDLFISNVMTGTMMAVREDFARAIPAGELWLNYGEDDSWWQRVVQFGFLCCYFTPEDAYLLQEEDVGPRATNAPNVLIAILVSEALNILIKGDEIDKSGMLEALSLRRLKKYSRVPHTPETINSFFTAYREALNTFLANPNSSPVKFLENNPWYIDNRLSVSEALKYLISKKDEIFKYSKEYRDTHFSGINTILGPLRNVPLDFPHSPRIEAKPVNILSETSDPDQAPNPPPLLEQETTVLFPNPASFNKQMLRDVKTLYEKYPIARSLYDKAACISNHSVDNLLRLLPEAVINNPPGHFSFILYEVALYNLLQEAKGNRFRPMFLIGTSSGLLPALMVSEALPLDSVWKIAQGMIWMYQEEGEIPYRNINVLGVEFKSIKPFLKAGEVELFEDAAPHNIYLTVREGPGYTSADQVTQLLRNKLGSFAEVRLSPQRPRRLAHVSFQEEQFKPMIVKLVESVEVHAPVSPVMSSTLPGKILKTEEDVRTELIEMIFKPIRWREAILEALSKGTKGFLHVGPGDRLKKVNEMMFPGSITFQVHNPSSAEEIGWALGKKKTTPLFSSSTEFFSNYEKWRSRNPDAKLLVMARHGESRSNLLNLTQSIDDPLTRWGFLQVEALSCVLAECGISFDRMISSDLVRAEETMKQLVRETGKTYELMQILREVPTAPVEGVSRELSDIKKESEALKNEFFESPISYRVNDFSMKDFDQGLDDLLKQLENRLNKNILIVSHAITMSVVVMKALNISYEDKNQLIRFAATPNAGITVLSFDNFSKLWTLLVLADGAHLSQKKQSAMENDLQKQNKIDNLTFLRLKNVDVLKTLASPENYNSTLSSIQKILPNASPTQCDAILHELLASGSKLEYA